MSSYTMRRMREMHRRRARKRRAAAANAAAAEGTPQADFEAAAAPAETSAENPVALARDIKVKRFGIDLFLPGNPS